MIKLQRGTITVLLVLFSVLLTAFSALAQADSTRLRFVHVVPNAPAVDILIDGQPVIVDLAFGEATNYVQVAALPMTITVNVAGTSNTVWAQEFAPVSNGAQTLVASSSEAPTFTVYTDDLNPLPLGRTRFTAIHAIEGAPTVDIILADGRPVIPGLQYNQPYGTLDLPTAVYELAVVPAGAALAEAILPAVPFPLNGGMFNIALAYGTPTEPQVMVLTAPTRAEVTGGQVRLVHAVPGAPDVDVFANDVLITPSLTFSASTEYIALPVGSYEVVVRAAGDSSGDALITAPVEITENLVLTAYVVPTGDGVAVLPSLDNIRPLAAQTASFTLINAASNVTATASSEFGALFGEVASGDSASGLLTAIDSGITVTLGDEEMALPFNIIYGGTLYNAVIVDGASGAEVIALPPVAFAQTVASAPSGSAVVAVPSTPEPVEPDPTTAAPEVAQASTVVEPTTAPPVAEPTQVPPAQLPPAPTDEPGPTALVLTNPGVNLQLRQYPSSQALSLGLAPSGTVLRVLGREGAPEPPPIQPGVPTATPDPEEEDVEAFIDPVLELEPGEDLDPASTWLNVIYETPDGGAISAWVNALYIGVRDAEGRAQRLRDLPTVPNNRPGQAINTAITPPTRTPITVSAITTNVSPGANIHIRRLPTVAGESLALVPPGTTTRLIGINEAETWVFVEYAAPDRLVRGWIAFDFVVLERLNSRVTLDRLRELLELEIIDNTERGSVVLGAAPTSPIPADERDVVLGQVINLNPGANLHLRRFDTPNAESLALIPVGASVTVSARNEAGDWVRGTYSGITGWMSAQFLRLTLNGAAYDVLDLPIVEARPRTPTPSPDPNATPTPEGEGEPEGEGGG